MPKIPLCFICRHYLTGYTCEAFPAGIPDSIIYSEIDHRRPAPGDRGIRFEPSSVLGQDPDFLPADYTAEDPEVDP